jgi:hypothetical protein
MGTVEDGDGTSEVSPIPDLHDIRFAGSAAKEFRLLPDHVK